MRGEPWNSIIQIETVVFYYLDKAFFNSVDLFSLISKYFTLGKKPNKNKRRIKVNETKKSNVTFSSNNRL